MKRAAIENWFCIRGTDKFKFIHVFYMYESSVFMHTRRRSLIPLQMIVSNHMVAGT